MIGFWTPYQALICLAFALIGIVLGLVLAMCLYVIVMIDKQASLERHGSDCDCRQCRFWRGKTSRVQSKGGHR